MSLLLAGMFIIFLLAVGHVADVQQYFSLLTLQIKNLVDAAAHYFQLLGQVALDIIQHLILHDDTVLPILYVDAKPLDLLILLADAFLGSLGALLYPIYFAGELDILVLAFCFLQVNTT